MRKGLVVLAMAALTAWVVLFDACVLLSAPLLDGVWPKSAISMVLTLQVAGLLLLWGHAWSPEKSLLSDVGGLVERASWEIVVFVGVLLVFLTLFWLPQAFRTGEGKPNDDKLQRMLTSTCLGACDGAKRIGQAWQSGERPVVGADLLNVPKRPTDAPAGCAANAPVASAAASAAAGAPSGAASSASAETMKSPVCMCPASQSAGLGKAASGASP